MLTHNQITINSIVNFEYTAQAILGGPVRNAKVLAILDADSAAAYINPMLMHANVAGGTPGLPSRHTDYLYVKIRLSNGVITAVGIPWIREASWAEVTTASLRFTVANVPPEKIDLITRALAANGFTAVDIEVV